MNDTKYYCQNPGCENEIEEPQRCCNGSDCGCYGMPVDPLYCSQRCETEHSIYKRLEIAHEKVKARGVIFVEAGAGKAVMAIAAHTALATNTNLVIIEPKKEKHPAERLKESLEETISLMQKLEDNLVYVKENRHPFQKFIGKPAHPYRRKK